jgi:small subunit ribosomal protein S16
MARGKEERLRLSQERIDHWVKMGAQPTIRVAKLIKEHKASAGKPAEIRPTRNEMKRDQATEAAAALSKKLKEEAKKAAEEAKAAEADAPSNENQ